MSDEERKDPDATDPDPVEFLNREGDDDDDFPLDLEEDAEEVIEEEPPVEADIPEETPEEEPVAAPPPPPPADPDDDDVDTPVAAAEPPPPPESVPEPEPEPEPAPPPPPETVAEQEVPPPAPVEEDEQEPAAAPVTATRRVRRGGGGLSRIMIGAGVVIIAVALFIFWPRGGGTPEEGDFTSVVTLPDTTAVTAAATPRSSDVDLDQELQDVVPEKPDIGETTPEGTRVSLRQEADERSGDGGSLAEPDSPATTGTAPSTADVTPTESVATGSPTARGKWAIQLGAFGTRANAAKVVDELEAKGYRGEVVSMPATGGGTSYKAWIGYFETRAAATAYARRHRDALGTDTYITHR